MDRHLLVLWHPVQVGAFNRDLVRSRLPKASLAPQAKQIHPDAMVRVLHGRLPFRSAADTLARGL
jgi:hypothetical protein